MGSSLGIRKVRDTMARARKAQGRATTVLGSNPVCTHCKKPVPIWETARTFVPPDGYDVMPTGVGFVICGEECPALPEGAEVFYRRLGYAWERGKK